MLLMSIGVFLTTPGAHTCTAPPPPAGNSRAPTEPGMIFRTRVPSQGSRRRRVAHGHARAEQRHVDAPIVTQSAGSDVLRDDQPVCRVAQAVVAAPSERARSPRARHAIVGRCAVVTPEPPMTATIAPDETAPAGGRSSTTLPALDSMRAVAAIAVLATHASFWGGAYAQPVVRHGAGASRHRRRDLLRALRLPAVTALVGTPRPSPAPHRRRAATCGSALLRIFPVYVLAVVAALLLLPGNNGASPGAVGQDAAADQHLRRRPPPRTG